MQLTPDNLRSIVEYLVFADGTIWLLGSILLFGVIYV